MEPQTTRQKKSKATAGQMITGSEAIIRSLIEEGIDTIFGYVGGAIMPVYDALYDHSDKIHHVMVRHEQGAIHAADAYARLKKKPGVCFVTSGPGATNLITGLSNAMLDSVPLVCLSGQVPGPMLGADAFQETDLISISMPVTKWNFQITQTDEIPEAMARAFYIANSGRPGPVVIDLTKNAQINKLEWFYRKKPRIRSFIPYPKLDIEAVEDAAKLIDESERPMILAGHGILISEAHKELTKFAEKTGIPVASTLLGLSAFPSAHTQFVGMLGMHGNYGPNINTNKADLIIAIGMRFDDRVTGNLSTYAKQARVIHIEIDRAEIDKNVKADVAIIADAKQALIELNKKVRKREHTKWLQTFREYEKTEFEKVIRKDCHRDSGKIHMGEVIHRLSEKTKGNAIVVTDVGQHQMITARYYKFNKPFSLVTSGGLGTMGFGLPAGVGSKIAVPGREVYAITGDGGFQMTIQELGTIAQYQIPVKIILMNNSFLGMVRQWQDLFFEKRYSMTELVNPDFINIAREGYGIKALRLIEREKLEESLDTMIRHKGPFLLEVMVEKEHNVFPMVPAGGTVSEMMLE